MVDTDKRDCILEAKNGSVAKRRADLYKGTHSVYTCNRRQVSALSDRFAQKLRFGVSCSEVI